MNFDSNRRVFGRTLLAGGALGMRPRVRALGGQTYSRFEPSWASISDHKVPEWFKNAKLGIFIHWRLYSVPAWAPPTGELGKVDWNELFTRNPYAEWFL